MTPDERVGFNLRRLREREGMSRADLARHALIDRTVLSLHERGRRPIRLPELRRLAAVLGASFDDFAEGVTYEDDGFVVEEP